MCRFKTYGLLVSFCVSWISIDCQSLIQSGPMVGYSSMKEVGLWVQTKESVDVSINYWPSGDSVNRKLTKVVKTTSDNALIAHLTAEYLEPGIKYNYSVNINGIEQAFDYPTSFQTLPIWKWRGDAPDFTFIAGSCNYISEEKYDRPGKPYGGQYDIFKFINEENPDFMVWLGDNTYLREPDWDSKSGIYYRNTHTRSLKELQPLLANTHHYAIWDDHDFGPNDSEGSYSLKNLTLQAFKDFWFNPSYGAGGTEGITGFFNWNDCDFFLLDNRWYRTPQDSLGTILGNNQVTWLINALKSSSAKFKFICVGGQFLSDAPIFENHAIFAKERSEIIELIDVAQIKNIIFLTGDRHHSEISKITTNNGNTIYDITSSPMTSGAYDHSDEQNKNRVNGSMIGIRNYAKISVSGPSESRILNIEFKNTNGELIYKYEILAQ